MNDEFAKTQPLDDASELITYLPPAGDADVVKWRGVEFHANVPVRLTNKDHIEAARGNRFFRVGDEVKGDNPNLAPSDAMEYRAHAVDWIARVSTVDQLVRNWSADRDLRIKCEVGYDDIMYLGTLVEPKLRQMRLSEGLSDMQVAEVWVKHGILDIPWRS